MRAPFLPGRARASIARLAAVSVVGVILLSGCASGTTGRDEYRDYLEAVRQSQPKPEPLVAIEFSESGQILSLRVSTPPEVPEIRPFKPTVHPGWSILGDAVRIGLPFVGGAAWTWASGRAFERVLEAGTGPTATTTTTTTTTDASSRTRTVSISEDTVAGGDLLQGSPDQSDHSVADSHDDNSTVSTVEETTTTTDASMTEAWTIDTDIGIDGNDFSSTVFPEIPQPQGGTAP